MLSITAFRKKIGKIECSILDVQNKIEEEIEPYKDYPKILILGATGSGKTSLLCCLANKYVKIVERIGGNKVLECDGIGYGIKSITKKPTFHVDLNNELIYCDCPGFKDSEGLEQEIVNAFAIDHILSNSDKNNNKMKILLVASIHELKATRLQNFMDTLDQLRSMFPNVYDIKKSIGLVITQGDLRHTGVDYMNQLGDKNDRVIMKLWIDYFITNSNQVFVFPEALVDNVNQRYDFEDHDKLMYFLLNRYDDIPEHKISLSANAINQLEIIKENQIKRINEILSDFSTQILNQCDSPKDSNSIQSMINKFNGLINENIKNSDDLAKAIHQYLPNNASFNNEYFENLKEFEVLNSFLDKIISIDCISSMFEKNLKRIFNEANKKLSNNLSHAQEKEKLALQINQMQNHQNQLESQLNRYNSEINRLNEDIKENNRIRNQLEKKIVEYKREKDDKNHLKHIIELLERQIRELNTKNDQMQKQIQNMMNKINKEKPEKTKTEQDKNKFKQDSRFERFLARYGYNALGQKI